MSTVPSNSRQIGFGDSSIPVTVGEDPFREIKAKTAGWEQDSAILLFDARHAAYRAIHTREGLNSPAGEDTRGLHGFLEIVSTCCQIFKTKRFCLFWDGSVENKRKVHPGYKLRQDAAKTDEEIRNHEMTREAMRVTREGSDRLGLPTAFHPEFEADDMIGVGARMAAELDDQRIVIVSDDKDFYQLIDDRTFVWRGIVKKLVGPEEFASQFPFKPPQYVDWKALVGEPVTGDNIPGVKGFGDKTASSYIGSHGSLQSAIDYAVQRIKQSKPKPYAVDVALANNIEAARLSYRLSAIATCRGDLAQWSTARSATAAERAVQDGLGNDTRRISLANASRVLRGTYGFAAETCLNVLPPMGIV